MYRSVLAAFFTFTAVTSGEVCNLTTVFFPIDKILFNSNYERAFHHPEGIVMDVSDFESDLGFNFMGLSLPFISVSLQGSKGNFLFNTFLQLHDTGSYSYSYSEDDCSLSEVGVSLTTTALMTGFFPKLSFDNVKAKFLFWEIESKFEYSFEPFISFSLYKNTTYCGMMGTPVSSTHILPDLMRIEISHPYVRFPGALNTLSEHFWSILVSLSTFDAFAANFVRVPLMSLIDEILTTPWRGGNEEDAREEGGRHAVGGGWAVRSRLRASVCGERARCQHLPPPSASPRSPPDSAPSSPSASSSATSSTVGSCTSSTRSEMSADPAAKKKKSALTQLIKSSPFYKNGSVRLSFTSLTGAGKKPSNGLVQSNGLFPKLSFRRAKEDPGACSPSDDDGGFASWSGSCDRLAQIREIIKKRSEALAHERVTKSQSAYVLPERPSNGPSTSVAPASPARPTTLPSQSRKNEVWIPPEPSASPKNVEFSNAFPFYTPPAPISLTRVITPVFHQPQTVSTPMIRSGPHLSRNPVRPHSVAGSHEFTATEPPKSRPHSIASEPSWSPQVIRSAPPATSATSPSDSGYRSLPSATSDYQIKSPATSVLQTSFNSLPSASASRRLSLPNASRSTTTPRPSPTFHGLPFRPAIGLSPSSSSLSLLVPGTPMAPANTPIKGPLTPSYARTLDHLDDKVCLLFDILDTQERFAKVTLSPSMQ
ncbi:hypothetical protein GE061_019471 [Apolygus lucorum]|uniref:Uncharacterized protein n=1 Tax=Apolygus lucorum TaxID=248454 RepID=A0A6A4JNH6_APOLU|nr:hypothetical protein GE061_019471 [Apolygus lucorum]